MTKWIRADHAQAELQAAVAAAYEDAAKKCQIAGAGWEENGMRVYPSAEWCADHLRKSAPDDAQAALEAVKAEARAEALREAAWLADHYILSPAAYGEYNSGESHAACEIERQILALISADQKEDQ